VRKIRIGDASFFAVLMAAVFFMWFFSVGGCAWNQSATYEPPTVCVTDDGSPDSLILTTFKDPRLARDGIVVAVVGGMAAGLVDLNEVLDAVHGIQAVLDAGCSYSGLAAQVSVRVDNAKIQAVLSVVAATGLLERMQDATSDVSDCDRELLRRLCAAVESAVTMYQAGELALKDLE